MMTTMMMMMMTTTMMMMMMMMMMISSQVLYGELLADVDYLHGIAESLLGVTNIVIALNLQRGWMAIERELPDGKRPDRWR
jgi:hypothetical protein